MISNPNLRCQIVTVRSDSFHLCLSQAESAYEGQRPCTAPLHINLCTPRGPEYSVDLLLPEMLDKCGRYKV